MIDTYNVSGYTQRRMIQNFRHRGRRGFFEKGQAKGIHPPWRKRVRAILARLNAARGPDDMDLPGLSLHRLRGALKGHWAVTVSGNWRITFRFDSEDACDVDLADYH